MSSRWHHFLFSNILTLYRKNLRRNSSRAPRKATKEVDPNDSILSRTSYSLPTTPLATTFDEPLPQSKRRKTQGSVNGDEKARSPVQEAPEAPSDRKVLGFQAVNTMPAKVTPNGDSDKPNGDTTQEDGSPKDHSTDYAVNSTTSSNGRRQSQSAKSQSSLHAYLEPQNRRKSLPTESELAEPKQDEPNTKTSTLDNSATQGNRRGRKPRKSMPAKLSNTEDVENNINKSQDATPRPGRKAKAAAQANAEALKLSSRKTRTPRNLAASKSSKDQNNGAADSTPASLPTGTRRRYRKSIRNAANATPSQPATGRKRGRPAAETRDHEMVDSALQSPDGAHSGNDTEMYGDGFGAEGPASPKSLANAARTSRRTRKPTMRAMESLESEKRYRRRKAADEQLMESARAHHPDLAVIAQRLFELAAEAVSPDFVATSEAKTQLTQLKEEYWAKKSQKESTEAKPEEVLTSQPAFSKKTQVSEPWIDERGWTHTGHVNEHGEEYLFAPQDFDLYRPNNTYNDKQLPEPPLRLRSREQAEKDRVFGFPPRIGERNIPQKSHAPFMFENVEEEMAKIKARDEARQQGITVDRSLSATEIRALIAQHGQGRPQSPSPKETPKPVRRRRRRTQALAEDGTEVPAPKRGRKRRQPATAPSTPAQEPESPDKKTMKIKLKFGKGTAMAIAQNGDGPNSMNEPLGNSRKRALSATGDDSLVGTPGLEERSSKIRKLSTSEADIVANPDTPTAGDMRIDATPASASTQRTDAGSSGTPRGRPRRRGPAAVVNETQDHADGARGTSARKEPATLSISESHDNPSAEPAIESFDTV